MLNEALNRLRVTHHRCIHQRGEAVVVLRINVARHHKNSGYLLGIAMVGRSHQIGLPGVRVIWITRHG